MTHESKFYYINLKVYSFDYSVHMVDILPPSTCSFTHLLFSVTLLCYDFYSPFTV
jgi:hypothetical protein